MKMSLLLWMLFYQKCAGTIISKTAMLKTASFAYTGTFGFQKINRPIKHIGRDILKGQQKNSFPDESHQWAVCAGGGLIGKRSEFGKKLTVAHCPMLLIPSAMSLPRYLQTIRLGRGLVARGVSLSIWRRVPAHALSKDSLGFGRRLVGEGEAEICRLMPSYQWIK